MFNFIIRRVNLTGNSYNIHVSMILSIFPWNKQCVLESGCACDRTCYDRLDCCADIV